MIRPAALRRALPVIVALCAALAGLLPSPPKAGASTDGCTARVMIVVAHPDDDLFFLNPDIQADISAGRCVRTVVVTAGDNGRPAAHWQSRETGLKTAYAQMAGKVSTWREIYEVIGGGAVYRYELVDRPNVELVFVHLPDGSTGVNTLTRLDSGAITSLTTVDGINTFTKATLTSFLTALLNDYSPTVIRTLTGNNTTAISGASHHSDHLAVGQFITTAEAATTFTHVTYWYVDNPVIMRPKNLTNPSYSVKESALLQYAKYDDEVCDVLVTCDIPVYTDILPRRYVEGSKYTGTPPVFGSRIEAESAVSSMTARTVAGATGSRALGPWAAGDYIEFSIDVPSERTIELRFRHKVDTTAYATGRLFVNGSLLPDAIPFILSPVSWGLASVQVPVRQGRNVIRLERAPVDIGSVTLDNLEWETVRVGHIRRTSIEVSTSTHPRPSAASAAATPSARVAAPGAELAA